MIELGIETYTDEKYSQTGFKPCLQLYLLARRSRDVLSESSIAFNLVGFQMIVICGFR
jgi:hypothetical protein